MKTIYYFFGILLFFASCVSSFNEEEYFNGTITYIDTPKEKTYLEANHIVLSEEGIDAGYFAVYDSLILFCYWIFPDNYYFSVFNLNNSEHLGYYNSRGQGPNETLGVEPVYQFFEENGELKTMLHAFNNKQLNVWNITKSLQAKTTVYDTIFKFDIRDIYYKPQNPYLLNNDAVILHYPYTVDNINSPLLPLYKTIAISSNNIVREYQPFKKAIINDNSKIDDYRFFNSRYSLKPDKSGIVTAMIYLSQINIIDLESGNINGYRIKGTPGFSIFKTDMSFAKYYYGGLQCDDKYIYTLYAGQEISTAGDDWGNKEIYVFDWNGNIIKIIELEKPVRQIWVDNTNHLLYGYTDLVEELYSYDLNKVLDY